VIDPEISRLNCFFNILVALMALDILVSAVVFFQLGRRLERMERLHAFLKRGGKPQEFDQPTRKINPDNFR